MRLPPSLRYLPARLQPLGRPAVWISVLSVIFLGAFAWEYRNFRPGQVSDSSAPSTVPLAKQPPRGPDSVDEMIQETRVDSGAKPLTALESAAPSDGEATAGKTDAAPSYEQTSPFAAYLEQYRFLGAGPVANTAGSGFGAGQGGVPLGSQLSLLSPTGEASGSQPQSAPSQSALGRALAQQAEADGQSGRQIDGRDETAANESTRAGSNLPQQGASQSGAVRRGTLPGNAGFSFIQTTPVMSPPSGTTGYTPPASLSLPTFDSTLNRTNGFLPTVPGQAPNGFPAAPSYAVPGVGQPQRSPNVLPGTNVVGDTPAQPVAPPAAFPQSPSGRTLNNSYDGFWQGY